MKKNLHLSVIVTLLISGCSNPFAKAKPKEPNIATNSNIRVVENVQPEPTNYVIESNDKSVTEKKHTKSRKKDKYEDKETNKKSKKSNHKMKPEPYSVKSQESDPELLGTQGTLKDKLKEKTGEM